MLHGFLMIVGCVEYIGSLIGIPFAIYWLWKIGFLDNRMIQAYRKTPCIYDDDKKN